MSSMESSNHEILLYTTPDGAVRVEVAFEDETFWLTQKKMADLFGIGVQTINHHLQEIYKSNELNEIATIRKIRIVQTEGSREVVCNIEDSMTTGQDENSFPYSMESDMSTINEEGWR